MSTAANDELQETVLEVADLSKTYRSGSRTLTVLDAVTFSLLRGESCAIVGPSGSGKTTLLGLCAGLDRSSSGSVRLCGHDMATLDEDARAALRNEHVGFIFQSFRLIPTLTAVENVMVPAELSGDPRARQRATDLLSRVGLADRADHYPAQLSGGEQQRTAIARAFVNQPTVLFADEPTGELDTDTGRAIVDLLFELNATAQTTLVLVTHDQDLAERSSRLIRLRGGRVESDSGRALDAEASRVRHVVGRPDPGR